MKIIYIQDEQILVDDEDYDFITLCYDLEINKHGYVHCKIKDKYKRKKMGLYNNISLHKLLIHPEKTGRSINVDHRDGNKLNNQKSNLRICTHQENMRNRKVHKKNSNNASQYKGVIWREHNQKWQAYINDGKSDLVKFLGCFTNEIAAANCYNYYAKKIHKEFAKLNDCPYMPKEEWIKYSSEKNKTSKYRGVSFINGKYLAQIWDGNIKKNIKIGEFDEEIEAAKAYNKKAIELKGNKARLNEF